MSVPSSRLVLLREPFGTRWIDSAAVVYQRHNPDIAINIATKSSRVLITKAANVQLLSAGQDEKAFSSFHSGFIQPSKQQTSFTLPVHPATSALSTDHSTPTIKLFLPLPSSSTYQVDGLHTLITPFLRGSSYILVRPIGMRT